ncbi:OmpA family protein [Myroides fluvii]|uniref:OmpA family protein n=1 Tax=Myroides fluvii TaxID=2572594 RepID=UPI00131B7364|nr:OmpA family protein [Myroides fluvii]
MKKIALLFVVGVALMACKQTPKEETETVLEHQDGSTTQETETTPAVQAELDLSKIPFTTADIGDFPYLALPKGVKELNRPLLRDFDVCFFPVQGMMTEVEGRLYKANLTAVSGEQFSERLFRRSMEEYLKSIGAVKIAEERITREEYDRYNKLDPHKGDEGDIGYADEPIAFYVIRHKEQGDIYIQYTVNNVSAKLNVLQVKAFEQTMTKITADEIMKSLAETGKSILYINFNHDQSTLTPEGKEVVNEIAVTLQKDAQLTIAIEGHTDNVGDANHNKKLSTARALAVKTALEEQKVAPNRLTATGFGAERPLLANDSEANKAKNRRVELRKTNG